MNVQHEVYRRGPVSLRTLYLRTDMGGRGSECRVFEVSEFLRALILETGRLDAAYQDGGRKGRIITLLLEEIERMPATPYEVSMPPDPRLLRVCEAILHKSVRPTRYR